MAIVDETMAAAFWPGENPIGRRVSFEFDGDLDDMVPTWRLLAAVGIYGVMAYSVSQRTHEIGVRMALGARAVDVVLLVQRRALVLIAAGLLLRAMSSVLFELSAGDLATFATVPLILATVALAAGYLPARRVVAPGACSTLFNVAAEA